MASALAAALFALSPPLIDGMLLRLDIAVALVVAILWGPGWGVIVALAATMSVSLGVGHPMITVISVLEVWGLGWLVRRGLPPALGVVLFWVLAGVPAIALGYGVWLERDAVMVAGLAIKQPLNSLLSMLVAQLVCASPRVLAFARLADGRPRTPAVVLRRQIFDGLAPLVVLPIVLLGLVLGRSFTVTAEADARDSMSHRTRQASQRIGDVLRTKEAAIASLSRQLASHPDGTAAAQEVLLRHLDLYPTFRSMIVTDATGHIVAAWHRISEPPGYEITHIGATVADREYFTEPMRTGQLFRSRVFQGRGFGSYPIVAISAPIPIDGRNVGIVEGSLDLTLLTDLVAELPVRFLYAPDHYRTVTPRASDDAARAPR